MEKIKNGHFFNPSKGNLTYSQTIEEILNYIKEKPEKFYDVVVGCDSSSNESPFFPMAIVVLRKNEGGRFFLKKIKYKNRKFYHWKERIFEEVCLSCKLALGLKADLEERLRQYNYQFRYIHADVGENGATRDMIKEVIGLINGNGFEAKIKPESFAATCVADKFS